MSRSNKVCLEIMKHLISEGFTNQVHVKEVEKAIIYVRGPDKRTIQNWKRALETLGYLEKISPYVYQLNFMKCPELLVNVLHEQRQKKLL